MSDQAYWDELITTSFEENGIAATEEQIKCVAADADSAHENYDLCHYTPSGPSQAQLDLDRVRKELQEERDKVHCEKCNGTGENLLHLGPRTGISQCWKCRGEGRYLP